MKFNLFLNVFWRSLVCLCILDTVSSLNNFAISSSALDETQIQVLGIIVDVDTRPDIEGLQYTLTAIKDIPWRVPSFVGFPGQSTLPNLPDDSILKAELRGPQFGNNVVTLSTSPNQAFEVGRIRVPGDYTLFNIRLEDSEGNILLRRDETLPPVKANVIEELLATEITSRPLTANEIDELNVAFDEDSFQILNFTVGLTFGSNSVNIELPVVVPVQFDNPQEVIRLQARVNSNKPKRFEELNIPNLSIVGFQLAQPPSSREQLIELPAINGVIIIPGDIAFLNQFFSVLLQTTNLAPEGAGLDVFNATASITLPFGQDNIADTGDDPLRLANIENSDTQSSQPLLDENDSDTIFSSKTNDAQFLVEGLKEGAHIVNFDITGDLFVPTLGETVPVEGNAAGIVEVKNPTFDVVLSHPNIVREGEPYSLFATVTNISNAPANFFNLNLNTRGLSGASLAEGETEVKMIESISPGQAETVEYKLIAGVTGEVTGTVFLADEGINGSFILTTGVGDTGIPLSADTLLLPDAISNLPRNPDISFAAIRLLGQAYSVATAPAGSLPSNIDRINKSYVFERGGSLGIIGAHSAFGQNSFQTAIEIVMDYFGADIIRLDELIASGQEDIVSQILLENDIQAFDSLRRQADAGENLTKTLAKLITPTLESIPLAQMQLEWAESYASRPAHLSFGISSQGPPVNLQIIDEIDNITGQSAIEETV